MKTILRITLPALSMLVCLWASIAMAASFTAQLVKTHSGKTETEKFYLSHPYYRMEHREGDKPVVVIADREKNLHHVLDLEDKVYFDIVSDDFKVLSMDPFAASEYMAATYGSQVEGTDNVNGMACERQAVAVNGKKILTRWISAEMAFPVKIVMHQGKQAAVTELRNIAATHLEAQLFAIPRDFKQMEEPGAAARRKQEALRQQEAAYAGITSAANAKVPCYVKIAAGGKLRVPVDEDRSVRVDVINQIREESVVTIWPYRNGRKVESIGVSPWQIKGRQAHRDREFNKDFRKGSNAFTVDELRIEVERGLVYAHVTQRGPDRTDFYNYGRLQSGAKTDPKRSLTLRITGDNPFGENTSGTFWTSFESGGSSDKVPFNVKNGETVSFDYPADQKVKNIQVTISAGDGRAKLAVLQPPAAEAK